MADTGFESVSEDTHVVCMGKVGKDHDRICRKDLDGMGLRPFSYGLSMGITVIAVFGRYMWRIQVIHIRTYRCALHGESRQSPSYRIYTKDPGEMGLRPFSHGFSTDIVQIAVFGRYMWQTTMDKSVKISMCLWKGKKGEHDQRKDCKGFSVCGPFPWVFDGESPSCCLW